MGLYYEMKDGKMQTYYQEDEEDEILDDELEDEEDEEEGLLLSEKHGVNPTMDICMICGEVHQLILLGKLPNDEEAPKQVCTGQVCQKCIDKLEEEKQRIYLEVKENIPTGRYSKIPDEYINPEYLEQVKERRIIYLSTETFNNLFNNESTTDTTND